ncbi:P-loop NTPase fold protein [Arcobacter cloacae]|uniref:KAP NTPase domain-containing protein n=1 Tax=Arcobacter cloacae TaxID=1054034 RepID=A0A4Q0ZDI8_9BACT|nr:P-loop NTPase fold protein [Arcobacter cloacae]RXJ84447.1 hypothetical protein CRU90_06155 [Arcobacter cloacae]
MANAEILKNYLVVKNRYLLDDNNNGKVIMLSGKWGSGKTYFWKNKIQTVLNDENKKIPNHYISLYGKTSIQEIKNEVFLKIFESVDSFESEEKTKNIVKSSIDVVSSLTKSISVFGMSLDLSKITDKSFEKIDSLLQDEKLKRTETYLNNGAVICFDDFERKSKDIDLNDLFGFITQLTLNFSCKVVIILNDDVFEGEEKKIFSNVKEKSVSKFFKYEPSIKELFHSIYEKHGIFKSYPEWEETILKYIEESQILNARIYTQVLDNILEFFNNTNDEYKGNNEVLRCLILVNINYILYHTIFSRKVISSAGYIHNLDNIEFNGFNYWSDNSSNGQINHSPTFEHYIMKAKKKRYEAREKKDEEIKNLINFIDKNINLFKSNYFSNKLDISRNVDDKTFQKINDFIETGILIDE